MQPKPQKEKLFLILEYDYVTCKPRIPRAFKFAHFKSISTLAIVGHFHCLTGRTGNLSSIGMPDRPIIWGFLALSIVS